jgi:hypothetical protein
LIKHQAFQARQLESFWTLSLSNSLNTSRAQLSFAQLALKSKQRKTFFNSRPICAPANNLLTQRASLNKISNAALGTFETPLGTLSAL